MTLRVSVCIATHNRREDLSRTLREVSLLDPPPDEILVMADGCSDGTSSVIRDEWPRVRLFEHERSQGSIPSRNELAATATGDILLSLDDDSYPLGRNFVARLRETFATHPKVAVLSFAQRTNEFPASLHAEDLGPAQYVGSFANSAAATRREVFLALGGYPSFFRHAYEEPDLALRCAAAGWQVRHDPSFLVRHHFTPNQRDEMRTHHRHSRNELWSVVLRCPFPHVILVAAFRVLRQAGYARKRGIGWLLQEPKWWREAVAGIPICLRERHALPWCTYLSWMKLIRHPITDRAEWEKRFPSPRRHGA